MAWLLDQCPPEYRGYPVINRNPGALAWLAGHHADAGLRAVRVALATARAGLADQLSPPAMNDLLEALGSEQARLIAARRATHLVEEALRGHRYIPRL